MSETFLDTIRTMPSDLLPCAVKKEIIWPWNKDTLQGKPQDVVFLIQLIRDRLSAEPNWNVRQYGARYNTLGQRNTRKVAEDFIISLETIKELAENCNTVADVKNIRKLFRDKLDIKVVGNIIAPEKRHLLEALWKNKIDPLIIDYKDMVALKNNLALNQGDEQNKEIPVKENIKDVVKKKLEKNKASPIPSRPFVETMEFNTPVSEYSLYSMGFHSIEFSPKITEEMRQNISENLAQAFADLSECLGIKPEQLGMGVKISIGGRKSPRQINMYDIETNTIYLSMNKWGGDIARLWAEAFDAYESSLVVKVNPQYATGVARRFPRKLHPELLLSANVHNMDLWNTMSRSIWVNNNENSQKYDNLCLSEKLIVNKIKETETQYSNWLKTKSGNSQEGQEYEVKVTQWIKDTRKKLNEIRNQMADLEVEIHKDGFSDYVNNAYEMDKNGNTWAKPSSLFSRVFECAVFDYFQAKGLKNDYLVYGVEPERFQEGYRGNPYPVGTERQNMTRNVMELVKSELVAHYAFGKNMEINRGKTNLIPIAKKTLVC